MDPFGRSTTEVTVWRSPSRKHRNTSSPSRRRIATRLSTASRESPSGVEQLSDHQRVSPDRVILMARPPKSGPLGDGPRE
jgi:hypothetical protein